MASQLPQSLWDEEKEAILTQMWDERPFLYDHNVTGFNNRAKKDQAYREIAYAVGIPVGNVMKRMVSLRTQYSRAKNKGFRDDKPPSRKARWLLDHLAFLGPFIETRDAINGSLSYPKTESFEGNDTLVDHDMDFETTVLPPRVQFKKREFNPNKRKLEIEEGGDEDFPEELDIYQDNVKVLDGSIACSSPQVATTQYTPYPPANRKDQESLFCDFLAGELREIRDPIAKAKLINKIQNEVFAFKIAELYKAKEGKGSTEGNDPVPCQLSATVNCTSNNLLNTSNPAGTSSELVGVTENDSY